MPPRFSPSKPPASESPGQSVSDSASQPTKPTGETGDAAVLPPTKTRVQSALAIAAGYLFLALGVIVIMGLIVLQGIEEFTPTLLLILTITQLCLATTGSYITALLAPSKESPQPAKSLVKHGLGLTTLVFILWLISAITSNGQEPWSIHFINLITALIGISTGTWLRSRQIQLTSEEFR